MDGTVTLDGAVLPERPGRRGAALAPVPRSGQSRLRIASAAISKYSSSARRASSGGSIATTARMWTSHRSRPGPIANGACRRPEPAAAFVAWLVVSAPVLGEEQREVPGRRPEVRRVQRPQDLVGRRPRRSDRPARRRTASRRRPRTACVRSARTRSLRTRSADQVGAGTRRRRGRLPPRTPPPASPGPGPRCRPVLDQPGERERRPLGRPRRHRLRELAVERDVLPKERRARQEREPDPRGRPRPRPSIDALRLAPSSCVISRRWLDRGSSGTRTWALGDRSRPPRSQAHHRHPGVPRRRSRDTRRASRPGSRRTRSPSKVSSSPADRRRGP